MMNGELLIIFKCSDVQTISLGLSNEMDILEHFPVSSYTRVVKFQKFSILAIVAKSLPILNPKSYQNW